ncbi:S-layer homology domain-containing protein [Bacillus salitolerans]|uniref:S-layer homology domain-containing protein n=1 Tax=Bacillus salitolerans TaxID=1437434 RepID=A0ABW4LV94_9BACI
MVNVLRHELKKQGNETTIIVYLDSNLTEFAEEFGSRSNGDQEDVRKSVKGYISQKFPNLKNATVKVMVGSMLVTSFAVGGGILAGAGKAEAAAPTAQAAQAAAQNFKDISGTMDEETRTAIGQLSTAEVIKGYDDGTFKPYQEINRMQAAVILVRTLGLDTTNVTDPGFKDIPKTHMYYKEIAAATNAGLFNEADNFNPDGVFTRGQAASVLARAFDLDAETKTTPFNDVVGSGHEQGIGVLFNKGMVKGKSATSFDPNGKLNRSQFALMLQRSFKVDEVKPKLSEQVRDRLGIEVTPGAPVDPVEPDDVVAATAAVDAYEALTVGSYSDYLTSVGLETAARASVDVLTDETVKADLSARVDAQAATNTGIVNTAVSNVTAATNHVALSGALGFFSDVNNDLIAQYDTAITNDIDTADEIQTTIYSQNLISKFNTAVPSTADDRGDINQLAFYAAIQYGADKGLLTNVDLDVYFDTYLDSAVALTGAVTTVDTIQDSVISPAVNAILTDATNKVASAEGNPTGLTADNSKTLIQEAQNSINGLPDGISNNTTSKAALQERLDKVKAVLPVIDADNQVELLGALQQSTYFDRINVDFIADYESSINAIAGTKSVDNVQGAIDSVNLSKAQTAVTAAEGDTTSSTKIATAQSYVDLVKPDAENVTTKADLQARVNALVENLPLETALDDANALTGTSSNDGILAALSSLSVSSPDFDIATVDHNFLPQIAAQIDADGAGGDLTAAQIQTSVEKALVGVVGGLTAASADADVLAALAGLSKASTAFEYNTVIENLSNEYATAIGGALAADKDSAAEIQTIIQSIPLTQANALTGASTNDDISKALSSLATSSADLNAATINSALLNQYATQIAADKTAKAADLTAAEIQDSLDVVNNLHAVNTVTSASDMRTALTTFAVETGHTTYLDLSGVAKLEVAQSILGSRADQTDSKFANTTAVTSEIDAKISERATLIGNVNGATSITAMNTALDALNYGPYEALSSTEKINTAEAFLNAVPKDANGNPIAYTSLGAIHSAIDTAIGR